MNKRKNTNGKYDNPVEKIYFKNFKFRNATWEEGTNDKRIGKLWYLIKHPKKEIKRHSKQTKKKIYSGRRSKQEKTDDGD